MNRKFGDDVATSDVVWAAAERIGKTSNVQDITRIIEYLVNKHWFQTAGDLRVARESASEWQSLEVPARLKIAIQEVLDAAPGHAQSSPVKPLPGIVAAQSESYDTIEVAQESNPDPVEPVELPTATAAVSSDAYEYSPPTNEPEVAYAESGATYEATYEGYDYGGYTTEYPESPSHQEVSEEEAAAHAAAWEAYYAANGYYAYATYGTPSTEGDYSATVPSTDMTAAEEAVAIEANPVAEGVTVDAEWEQPQHEFEAPVAEPVPPVAAEQVASITVEDSESPVSWGCGQCTFINPISVAFCEMCSGHISLSPDLPPQPFVEHPTSYGVAAPEPMELPATKTLPPPPPPPAPKTPPRPPALEQPRFVSIPCPTQPLSPLYSPSAPDFDAFTIDEARTSPAKPVFEELPPHADDKQEQLTAPVPTARQQSSPPKVDYRALAFKRTPSVPSTLSSPPRTATEFSF